MPAAPAPALPSPVAPTPIVGRPIVGRPSAALAAGTPLKRVRPTGTGRSGEALERPPLPALGVREARAGGAVVEMLLRRRRSLREMRPSSCFEIASSALWHVTRFSSSSASERRARKRSVSSADVEIPSSSAISWYERPSSSRITSASRCAGGIFCSALTRPSSSISSSGTVAGRSPTSSISAGRAAAWRQRCRTRLWAIASSQLDAFRGCSPRSSARSAFTKVVWVTSSASAWFPRTAYV